MIEKKKEFVGIKDQTFKVTTIIEKKYNFNKSYMFNVGFAEKYGVNEAIILQNLIFWIEQNKANEKNFYDGYYWTFNSIKAFTELFPFWTNRQIGFILESLIKQGIIKKGNYNKAGYDRTLWYTIIDKSILQICQINFTEMSNQFDEIVKPIPDINTDIKPNSIMNDLYNTRIEELYNLYPSRDINHNNKSTVKSYKDKERIKSLLKKKSFEEIKKSMEFYLKECNKQKTWLKNFSVFLNNLPDIIHEEKNQLKQVDYHYESLPEKPMEGWGLDGK
jgi:hypothetical protein